MAAPAKTANAGGTHRKPRALKLVEGNPGKRPIEPEVPFERALPVKPATLSADAEWLWDQVIEQMKGIGLLKPLDAAGPQVACENFARWREAVRFRQERQILAQLNHPHIAVAPWIGIEERASREFRAWCAEFGLTPAAEKNLAGSEDSSDGDGANPYA